MATLVLQVPDESLVSKVKQACKMQPMILWTIYSRS